MDVTTTLLLVDDEMLVRAGLKMVLDGNQGISVVGEAGDGLAAVQAVEALRPDVVLMDIRMPGMDGIEAAGRISALPQAPAVVMLTAFDTEDFVADALDAGAQGFLL
ncbi:MAG: response regulator transcription factor, partial [Luteococcus japonicus]